MATAKEFCASVHAASVGLLTLAERDEDLAPRCLALASKLDAALRRADGGELAGAVADVEAAIGGFPGTPSPDDLRAWLRAMKE